LNWSKKTTLFCLCMAMYAWQCICCRQLCVLFTQKKIQDCFQGGHHIQEIMHNDGGCTSTAVILINIINVIAFNKNQHCQHCLLTWLLCIDTAHASFSGSWFLVSIAPPGMRTTHFSCEIVFSIPHANLMIGLTVESMNKEMK